MTLWTAGTTVTVEVALTTPPDDPFPQWTDISPYVQIAGRGGPIDVGRGRQTELTQAQSATLALALRNGDERFTPGNTLSPYYPYFKQARKIRVRETIGYRTFDIFTGYLEIPEVAVYDGVSDQVVHVTAVDRLTRLDRSRKFISTLTEHILYTGGAGLKAYYPLLEADGTLAYDKSRSAHEPLMVAGLWNDAVTSTQEGPTFRAGQGVALPGDDLRGPVWSPRLDAGQQFAESARLQGGFSTPITADASTADIVTVAAWVTLSSRSTVGRTEVFKLYAPFATGFSELTLWADTEWKADVGLAQASSTLFITTGPAIGVSQLVAIRASMSTGQVEFWRHTEPPEIFTLASFFSPAGWDSLSIGQGVIGTVSHVQVYVGAAAYTRATHLAQVTAGLVGLAGQLTGERVRTLAGYAGVPAGELDCDDGTVRMQNTHLAGRSPLDAMREAETTEQGVLIASGAGRLVFADHVRRYNI